MIATLSDQRHARWVFPVIALFLLVLVYLSQQQLPGDFGNYYFGSRFLLEGRFGPQVYGPAAFNLSIYEQGYRDMFLDYTPVPPVSALLYIPFAWFEPYFAKTLWNLLNSALFLFTLYRLHRHFEVPAWYFLLVPVIFFVPIRSNLFLGQSYFLLCFLLSEGLIACLEGRKWITAACWSLAILLKIFPAIVCAFLIFRKDGKTLAYLLLASIALVLLSMPFTGAGTWQEYAVNILPRLAKGEINNMYAQNYQSMQVLFRNMLVPDAMHNPGAWMDAPVLFAFVQRAYTLALLVAMSYVSLSRGITQRMQFAWWLLAGTLLSGYGSTYGLLLLLFLFVMITQQYAAQPRKLLLFYTLLFATCNVPVHVFSKFPLLLQYPRLYMLLLLFACLWYMYRPALKPLAIVWIALLCLPLLWLFSKQPKREDPYWLKQEEALLIYDFKVEGDLVQLYYFDQHGPGQRSVYFGMPVHSVQPVNNSGPQHAVRVNGRYTLYLSDEGRGVGFYTLRYHERP